MTFYQWTLSNPGKVRPFIANMIKGSVSLATATVGKVTLRSPNIVVRVMPTCGTIARDSSIEDVERAQIIRETAVEPTQRGSLEFWSSVLFYTSVQELLSTPLEDALHPMELKAETELYQTLTVKGSEAIIATILQSIEHDPVFVSPLETRMLSLPARVADYYIAGRWSGFVLPSKQGAIAFATHTSQPKTLMCMQGIPSYKKGFDVSLWSTGVYQIGAIQTVKSKPNGYIRTLEDVRELMHLLREHPW